MPLLKLRVSTRINQDAQALSKWEIYDGFVKVDLPGAGNGRLPIDELGDACDVSKRSVGKLDVGAFQSTGKLFVRQVVSGHTHGEVVAEVPRVMANAAPPYSDLPQECVGVGLGRMCGSALISAPDMTQSLGRSFLPRWSTGTAHCRN
jgi:hypothetical protein